MDLKSGRPFWLIKNGVLNRYSALDRDVCCEVVILGAGITGALVAYHLAKEGIPVIILDRREVGTGSTSATTGLLQYEVDTPLFKLAGAIGEKKAARSYHLSIEAIQKIQRLLGELGDNCGFERKQSLYLASRKEHVEDLKREYSARQSTGIRLDFLWAEPIQACFGLASPAALLSYDAAQVDAYRLTHVLLRSALSFGLQVYDQTEVSAYRTSKEGVEATTKTGHRIRCRKMVFAIGYEVPRCLQRDIVQLKSTYALVTRPYERLPQVLTQNLIWETARPYFYLRTTEDGRVMMGGEDDEFDNPQSRDARVTEKSQQLAQRFRAMFPEVDLDIAYRWAGTFGETKDGLAYIGENASFANAYFALGYGGNGITYSLIAAEIILDLYMGRGNGDAEIFRFSR